MAFLNREILDTVFRGLRSDFNGAFKAGEDPMLPILSTTIPASTASVRLDALFDLPQVRKWTSERVIHQLRNFQYTVGVDDYEVTIAVQRNDVLDDNIGLYSVQAANGGEGMRMFLPRKVAETLDGGAENLCYDGQNFFDEEHPVGEDGDITLVSNYLNEGGNSAASPWYLADLSRTVKPVLVIDRQAPDFQAFADMSNEHTFKHKEFLFGADTRAGFGYGLWQSCIRNEGDLSFSNLKAAQEAMWDFRLDKKDENGRRPKWGMKPTHLIVGSSNVHRAEALVQNGQIKAGSDPFANDSNVMIPNPFKKLQVLHVSWLP